MIEWRVNSVSSGKIVLGSFWASWYFTHVLSVPGQFKETTMKRLSTALLLLLFCLPARAQDPQKLVEQLGDASYEKRESASKELTKLKEKAKDALEAGLKSTDKETRQRCKKILETITKNTRLERFERLRKDPASVPDFPFWKEFQRLVGPKGNVVFCFMVEDYVEMMEAAAKDPKPVHRLFATFCDSIFDPARTDLDQPHLRHEHVRLMAMLVLTLDLCQGFDKDYTYGRYRDRKLLMQMICDNMLPTYLETPEFIACFSFTVGGLIKPKTEKSDFLEFSLSSDSEVRELVIAICLKLQLTEWRNDIFKVFENHGKHDSATHAYLLYFGKTGDRKYLETCKQFFSDRSALFTGCLVERPNPLQDYALLAALAIEGLSPKSFGYTNKKYKTGDSLRFYTLSTPQGRDRAFSAYADYLYR
jgi:hypothetical protein